MNETSTSHRGFFASRAMSFIGTPEKPKGSMNANVGAMVFFAASSPVRMRSRYGANWPSAMLTWTSLGSGVVFLNFSICSFKTTTRAASSSTKWNLTSSPEPRCFAMWR